MRFVRWFLFPAVLLVGCSKPDRISESNLSRIAYYLSSDELGGRESGTADGHRAAEFIRSNYIEEGLSPAFATGFTQEFPLRMGIKEGKSFARVGSKEIQGTVLPISLPGKAKGRIVFGGFCIQDSQNSIDDLADIDVKDSIVICLRYGPDALREKIRRATAFESKWENVRKAGGTGILFVNEAGAEPASSDDLPVRRVSGPVALFIEPGTLFGIFPALKEELARLRKGEPANLKELCKGGDDSNCDGEITTEYGDQTGIGKNIAALLNPYRSGQKIVAIGAHFDHLGLGRFSSMGGKGQIHNGADDNASGTAVVLETARVMRHRLGKSLNVPGDKNVLFLNFDGEERGLYGSLAFVNSADFPPGDIVAMINLDMVGRLRIEKGLSLQGKDTADPRWKDILEKSFSASGFDPGLKLKLISGGSGPSDHASFYLKGIPIAFAFTGYHMQYHRPQDDFALLNIPGMATMTEMTVQITERLLALDSPLKFERATEVNHDDAFDFKVRLGIMPGNYESNGEGVIVGGIHKGAPVEKIGLKEGDRIVMLGNKQIGGVRDLMEFLSDASTGKQYRIVFYRGSQKFDTTTELMAQ